jgi:DNA-binding FadR family transcriptional regulator
MAAQVARLGGSGERSLEFPQAQRTRARFGEEVVDVVTNQVVSGAIPPETPLPSEAEMAEGFGVSRTVVREALKELETMGLVEKHAGKRTWTAPASSWNLLDPRILHARVRHDPDFSFVDDVIDVRIVLEGEMAAQATTRASDVEVAELGRICAALEANLPRLNEYLELDTLFHATIMQTSRNQLATAVVTAIHSYARVAERFIGLPDDLLEELLLLTQEGHAAIFDRLAQRDAAGAESAMRAHIQSTWTWRRTHPKWQR